MVVYLVGNSFTIRRLTVTFSCFSSSTVGNPRLPAFSSAHFVDNVASARVLAKLGFEAVGRGRIACAARRQDVEVVTYWLDRQHALMGEPSSKSPTVRQPPARWRAWLGLFGIP